MSDKTEIEIRAESKLTTYLKGRRNILPATLPTGEGFVWRVLHGDEKQQCLAGSVQRFRELDIPESLRSYSDLEDECCYQILFRAMRDPDDVGSDGDPYPKTLAKNVGELRAYIDTDLRDLLSTEYLDFENSCDPNKIDAEPELFAAIVEAVKKKDAAALNNYEPRTLRAFLLSLEFQRLTSPNSNSPITQP